MNTYTGEIIKLKQNDIFVFGSNTEGKHGKGAALTAMKFGAIYGLALGRAGNTYAIITKNLKYSKHPSVDMHIITAQIRTLYNYAENHRHLNFIIAYSIKPNLNGYTPVQMASMFACSEHIPNNIIFEKEFYKLIKQYHGKSN